MKGFHSPSQKLSLVKQIEVYRKYNEHRKRLDLRYNSPHSLKKSLSFDQNKSTMFDELKNRKDYTNHFNKKEQSRTNEIKDAKMLRNILQYDQKLFVFSLSAQRKSNNFLHHNSRVTNLKNTQRIDSENQRIHFRITKAKSLYSKDSMQSSRQTPLARTFQLKKHHSYGKINSQYNPKIQKLRVETEMQNNQIEGNQGEIKNIYNLSNIKKLKQDLLRVNTTSSQNSFKKNQINKISSGFFGYANNSAVCDRIRREKLASRLYQKKLRFQNTILSKWHNKK